MATTTPNLGLTLPGATENVSRSILNTNFSLIDAAALAFQDITSSVTVNPTLGFTVKTFKVYRLGKLVILIGYLGSGHFQNADIVFTGLPDVGSEFRCICGIDGGVTETGYLVRYSGDPTAMLVSKSGTGITFNAFYITNA